MIGAGIETTVTFAFLGIHHDDDQASERSEALRRSKGWRTMESAIMQ